MILLAILIPRENDFHRYLLTYQYLQKDFPVFRTSVTAHYLLSCGLHLTVAIILPQRHSTPSSFSKNKYSIFLEHKVQKDLQTNNCFLLK